jgi:hypothetical protein
MPNVLYAYIAKPTTAQVGCFLRALEERGIAISHFGKSDPPRKFLGSVDKASGMVLRCAELTDYAFARDSAAKLHLGFQIHHDPRWTHSTVTASCPDIEMLSLVAASALTAFDLFISVRGVIGCGKEQRWEILHTTERCPEDLQTKFIATPEAAPAAQSDQR